SKPKLAPDGTRRPASKLGTSSTNITLNDGAGQLHFEAERPLQTLEKLDPVTRRQVLIAFKNQRLNKPQTLIELDPSTEFRGPALREESTPFKHLSPVNTVLVDDQPTFKWVPHPNAVGYRVRIFDDQDRKIAES